MLYEAGILDDYNGACSMTQYIIRHATKYDPTVYSTIYRILITVIDNVFNYCL